MRITICQEGRFGADSPVDVLLLVRILRTIENTFKLITIVLSIYELAMLFYHRHISDAYSRTIGL